VGVGGVGGYYGSRLALAGHPMHWVARSDVAHLAAEGLHVESPKGDTHLTDLRVSGPHDPLPDTDVVAIATKTNDNEQTAEWLAERLAGRSAVVLVLQNGLEVERPFAERLAESAPEVVVLGGMSFICAERLGPGHIRHIDYERVTVGAWTADGASTTDPAVLDAVTSVVDDLAAAHVPTEALADLVEGRRRKLMWNVPFNGLAVVLGASTAELVGDPSCRSLVRDLMTEVLSASVGTGHPVDIAVIDQLFASTERMVPYAPSMRVDYDAGRPLELEAIYATPLHVAAEAGVRMPRTEVLLRQLEFLDRRNRADR